MAVHPRIPAITVLVPRSAFPDRPRGSYTCAELLGWRDSPATFSRAGLRRSPHYLHLPGTTGVGTPLPGSVTVS